MVKARRNRQPRPWQDMTKPRSHSGILKAGMEMKATPVVLETQLKKIERNEKKLQEQIERHKKELYKAGTEYDRKSWLQGAIVALEKKRVKTLISSMAIKSKIETRDQAFAKKHETIEKQKEQTKLNAEKAERLRQYHVDLPDRPYPKAIGKQRIDNVGGKRKLKTVYPKTQYDLGQKQVKRPEERIITKEEK